MTRRKEIPTHFQDITKVLVLGENGKWTEPMRGKKFKARRYEKKPDGTLRRIKRSFETLSEAKIFRLGSPIEAQPLVQKSCPENLTEAMTFSDLIGVWKTNWLPTVNISTQLRYLRYLKHFSSLLKLRVVDIHPPQIDTWIAQLKRPEYLAGCHSTRTSYIHEFKVLKAILNYYSSRCNRNYQLPFLKDHFKMLKVKESSPSKKDLTLEQLDSLLNALRQRCWGTKWEAIYYLAVMQYAVYGRIQEAAALYVEDFDLVNNRLRIRRKIQWLREKEHQSRIVDGLKSTGVKVFEPIPTLAIKVLNEWRLRSGVRSGLLFKIDGKLIEYRQIQYRYDQALQDAKLPFTATHLLRHASLVEAYSTSPNILVVQKLAGHTSLRATEKYAKARDAQIVEVQRKMDEKLTHLLNVK